MKLALIEFCPFRSYSVRTGTATEKSGISSLHGLEISGGYSITPVMPSYSDLGFAAPLVICLMMVVVHLRPVSS